MSQAAAWEEIAERWRDIARADETPENWNAFAALLPPPGRLTVDVGCGEGRIPRALRALGHRVTGIDSSPTMIRLARDADPQGDYRIADAAALPLDDGSADLVVSFMALQDIDDYVGALREAARVLAPRGRLALALIHPFWSTRESAYFQTTHHLRPVLQVPSIHRPLREYVRALVDAGLLVDALDELPASRDPGDPVYLHARAVRP